MKLIIQIPCYNEAETLGVTLGCLPRQVPGFAQVEWLVIDDGSQDDTAGVARGHGVDHVVRHVRNQGLARAFMTGLDACLRLGADVIVNTDADNQYNADDIPALVEPLLVGRADIVVGARPIESMRQFSPLKKRLQRLGTWVVRVASGTDVQDATSGFRAMSRAAAQRLMVFNDYTYTLETIIQAGRRNMAVVSIPVRVNDDLRPSRLVRSIPSYVFRSIAAIVRIFIIYRPVVVFFSVGVASLLLGALLGLRYLYFLLQDPKTGHVPSLILASILSVLGFLLLMTGVLADLLAANRMLLEDIRLEAKALRQEAPPGREGNG